MLLRISSSVSAPSKKESKSFVATQKFNIGRGGLMVSALDSGASGLRSSPGRGHCVVQPCSQGLSSYHLGR